MLVLLCHDLELRMKLSPVLGQLLATSIQLERDNYFGEKIFYSAVFMYTV